MLVGATTLIAAIADFARTAGVDPDAGLRLAIGGASGFGAAIAGALIRRQLRLGVFVLELSWLTAVAAVLLTGARMGANVPLTIVLFVAAANWRALR